MAFQKIGTGGFTRRHVMAGFAASALTPNLANLASAKTVGDLHLRVAKQARELTQGGEVTLRLLLPNGSAANVTPVAETFKNLTGITIQISETQVDEINTELLLDGLSDSRRFDIALPATFGLPDLASAKAISPITDYANRYEPEGFRAGILYDIGDSFDGEIYGFQTDGDAYMTFFNKAMQQDPKAQARYIDTFGYALGMPDTWTELDQQMAFFHDPANEKWGGLLFRTPSYLAWEWWVRFHAKGIWPFSLDMEPQIASEQGVEALEDMIRATEHLVPAVNRLGLFENWERFDVGDVYCNIGWGGTQKYLNRPGSNMRDNLLFGPTPGGVFGETFVAMPYFNWGWDFVVTSTSKHPEIAYLFALFASSSAMSTLAVRQQDGFFDPFRAEHYEDAGITDTYTSEFLEVHRTSMTGAIPDLYLKGQGEYFRILADWLARALNKEVAPERALERVAQRWRTFTNGSGLRLQQERWHQLRSKYPPAVRAVLKDLG